MRTRTATGLRSVTPRRLRLSNRLDHNEREDEVRRYVPLKRNQGILSSSPHRECRLVIRRRAVFVCSKCDLIVELLKEFERDRPR